MTEREQIDHLHQQYLYLKENTPQSNRDGEECRAYHKWYDSAYVYFKSFPFLQKDDDFRVFVNAEKDGNCFTLEHIYNSISASYKVLMIKTSKMQNVGIDVSELKTNKIFISHCGADKAIVKALVDLLGEIININGDNVFCSSVHGFDVLLGENFMDNIKAQYKQHDLLLVYILSHNYMGSPMCLNEMGASWITKMRCIGFLTPGFDFDDLGNSCYDKQSISVVFNQEESEVRHRLNQFKDIVEELFPDSVKNINSTRWEEVLNRFIVTVKSIPASKKKDVIETVSIGQKANIGPKASIESSVYYKGKGSYVIRFTNNGSVPAEGLSVYFDKVDGIIVTPDRNLFPIEVLKPGRSFQIHAIMIEGAPPKMMSSVKWNEGGITFEDKELIMLNS